MVDILIIHHVLKNIFSEFSLFKYRLMIEIEYLIYLKSIELPELKDFPDINQELKKYL